MTPFPRPYERRHFKRFDMTTRDCRLTLIRVSDGKRDRENCILVNLSYAGLRFRGYHSVGVGELVEFLIEIRSPMQRCGFTRARVRWIRPLGFPEYDAGAEFSEQVKGLLLVLDESSLL